MASKPTIILIPGAWHEPKCFEPIVGPLQKAGYKTVGIDLPSVGPAEHQKDFTADVNAISAAISSAEAQGEQVVLVAHSYGSIPACEAVRNHESSVKHIFFCAAFIIDEGHSLIGAFGGNPLPWFKISDDQLEVNPDGPDQVFYNDLDASAQRDLVAQLKPFSYQCMWSPVTFPAWKQVPSTYLYTSLDAAIPLQIQQMMVEGTGKGAEFKTETVEAGHSPFLSKPEETAAAIRRAAGETGV